MRRSPFGSACRDRKAIPSTTSATAPRSDRCTGDGRTGRRDSADMIGKPRHRSRRPPRRGGRRGDGQHQADERELATASRDDRDGARSRFRARARTRSSRARQARRLRSPRSVPTMASVGDHHQTKVSLRCTERAEQSELTLPALRDDHEARRRDQRDQRHADRRHDQARSSRRPSRHRRDPARAGPGLRRHGVRPRHAVSPRGCALGRRGPVAVGEYGQRGDAAISLGASRPNPSPSADGFSTSPTTVRGRASRFDGRADRVPSSSLTFLVSAISAAVVGITTCAKSQAVGR